MNRAQRQCAFSAVEVITAVAILAILAGMLLGLGRQLRVQAEEKLAQSTIDIIVAALEQYYVSNGNTFPFEADVNYGITDFEFDTVDTAAGEMVTVSGGTNEDEYWSSEALFYFLNKTPSCKRIIDTITDIQITNKGSDNVPLLIEVPTGNTPIDLIRFIDPWDNALRYTYATGDTFPLIESAGADCDFDATGDNITSQ
jgi:Tfp pilus assembly protein PilE